MRMLLREVDIECCHKSEYHALRAGNYDLARGVIDGAGTHIYKYSSDMINDRRYVPHCVVRMFEAAWLITISVRTYI